MQVGSIYIRYFPSLSLTLTTPHLSLNPYPIHLIDASGFDLHPLLPRRRGVVPTVSGKPLPYRAVRKGIHSPYQPSHIVLFEKVFTHLINLPISCCLKRLETTSNRLLPPYHVIYSPYQPSHIVLFEKVPKQSCYSFTLFSYIVLRSEEHRLNSSHSSRSRMPSSA